MKAQILMKTVKILSVVIKALYLADDVHSKYKEHAPAFKNRYRRKKK
jgi:hypothetical protein